MVGVAYHLKKMHPYEVIDFNAVHYGLLIFSTLIIAAAGHLINDYFDLKADRINEVLAEKMGHSWALAIEFCSLWYCCLFVMVQSYFTIRIHSFSQY
jgi:4-hydroxybenzoate polyprenyltransferase